MRCDRITQLALSALLLAPLGCAQVDVMGWMHRMPEASAKNPVFNIVSVWEPSEGRNVDGMPARGFAGQIFFFTRSSPTPVKANGDVRVYVFDDQGTPEEQARPIHQFDFLGEAWTIHLQDSTLGPSYNVFIPYTREGEWQANCQLRLRFTSESGEIVYSDTIDVALPGLPRPTSADADGVADATIAEPVSQPFAARTLRPVETFQYGATLRQEAVRPTVANTSAPPANGPMQVDASAVAAPASSTVTQVPRRRFHLAASNTLPSARARQQMASHTVPPRGPQIFRAQPNQPVAYYEPLNQQVSSGQGTFAPANFGQANVGQAGSGPAGVGETNVPAVALPLGSQSLARHPLADVLE